MFVSDRIGPELRRIIEFLNSQMTATEVLAIGVKQYADADGTHQTIVPRVVGDTAKAREVKGPSEPVLTRETLLNGIRKQSASAADVAESVLDWAVREPRLDVRYTRTSAGIWAADRTFLRVLESGKINVELRSLREHGEPWDDERIEQLVQELADIGVQLGPTVTGRRRRLSHSLTTNVAASDSVNGERARHLDGSPVNATQVVG